MKDIDWKEAERRADNLLAKTRKEPEAAFAALVGFFAGGTAAMVTLLLVGYPADSFSGQRAVTLMGIVCGVVAYLLYRAKEKKRGEIWRRVVQDMEEDLTRRERLNYED